MTARRFLPIAMPWVLLVLAGLASAWLRYGFIEPPALAHLCDEGHVPWWCGARAALVTGFNTYGYGIAAIVVMLLALVWRKTWLATLAAMLGVLALIMYCYYAGALALLVGSLRLLRLQADRMASPRHPDRQRNRQVQAQP